MDTYLKNPLIQILVFGAAVYVLSFLCRRFMETAFSCLKRVQKDNVDGVPYPNAFAKWWNEFILYVLPPAWGVGVALFVRKTGLFPESFREWQMAVVFGIAFGSIDGLLYKLLKKTIVDKAGGSISSGITTNDVAVMVDTELEPAGDKPKDKP